MNYDEFISLCFKSVRKQKNVVENKIVLRELYETRFGIHDHRTETHPFGPVLFREAHEHTLRGLLHERVIRYRLKKIKELGYTLDEYLDLCPHEQRTIENALAEMDKIEERVKAEEEKKLKEERDKLSKDLSKK